MTIQLQQTEAFSTGVRRIAIFRINQVVQQLTDPSFDRDLAIHEARKMCKFVRAILRLVRADLGKEVYRRENGRFRDASRLLAPARDAAVMIETLDTLLIQRPGVQPEWLAELRQALVDRHQRITAELIAEGAITEFLQTVRAGQLQVSQWPLQETQFVTPAKGLKRVYRRANKEMKTAYREPSTEHFHLWRKRVKYLWHQLEMFEAAAPTEIGQTAVSFHTLSSLLGEEHDLAELDHLLTQSPTQLLNAEQRTWLQSLIREQRQRLQDEAKSEGESLFGQKPQQFVNQIAGHWLAWHDEIAGQPTQTQSHIALDLSTPPDKPLFTTSETAVLLNTEPAMVRQQIQLGQLPGCKIGAAWFVTPYPSQFTQHLPFLSTDEYAQENQLTARQVRRQIRNEQLPAQKIGRYWIITTKK